MKWWFFILWKDKNKEEWINNIIIWDKEKLKIDWIIFFELILVKRFRCEMFVMRGYKLKGWKRDYSKIRDF